MMKHPYHKYVKIERLSMLIAVLFTVLTIIYKEIIIFLFALCFVALSLLSEAMFLFFTNKKVEASKQIIRSLLLLLLLVIIIFNQLKLL